MHLQAHSGHPAVPRTESGGQDLILEIEIRRVRVSMVLNGQPGRNAL